MIGLQALGRLRPWIRTCSNYLFIYRYCTQCFLFFSNERCNLNRNHRAVHILYGAVFDSSTKFSKHGKEVEAKN